MFSLSSTKSKLEKWVTHKVIILNRGSMFAFQWIFPGVRLRPQTPSIDKRDRRRCNSLEMPSLPPPNRAISQWTCSLEWRHAMTLQILVGNICITFFPFSCEACSLYLVLWLCEWQWVFPLLGDSDFPTAPYMMVPIWNPVQKNERVIIERVIGQWKIIFGIPFSPIRIKFKNIASIILSTAFFGNDGRSKFGCRAAMCCQLQAHQFASHWCHDWLDSRLLVIPRHSPFKAEDVIKWFEDLFEACVGQRINEPNLIVDNATAHARLQRLKRKSWKYSLILRIVLHSYLLNPIEFLWSALKSHIKQGWWQNMEDWHKCSLKEI